MTYKTDEIGVLTQEEVNRIWKRSVSVGNSSHHLSIAQAQHQATREADIEKVKALIMVGPESLMGPAFKCGWNDAINAVLEALGESHENPI